VAQIVSGAEGAIGYVDLADANATGLQVALIENAAGEFVEPTLEGASAAVDGAEVEPNLAYNPLDAEGEDAYPITAPTWILVYKEQPADKVDVLKGWLEFLLTDAQEWAEEVDYAPLPDGMREDALAQLDEIVAG
jgi:phosphate transport system substrate-binding protein